MSKSRFENSSKF